MLLTVLSCVRATPCTLTVRQLAVQKGLLKPVVMVASAFCGDTAVRGRMMPLADVNNLAALCFVLEAQL
jgi:hypothetical protein